MVPPVTISDHNNASSGLLRTETLAPADEPAHVFRLGAEIVR